MDVHKPSLVGVTSKVILLAANAGSITVLHVNANDDQNDSQNTKKRK